jgi:hypothetical protein
MAAIDASCQELIDRAMQASGGYCNQIGSNKACYGNITVRAEMAPGTTQRFSERGDVVDVDQLRRISASSLNLVSREWGIAVFKVMANLPRSLPGEIVTMVVFGNTSLDKPGQTLETFYFSSELGQIVCDKVPFDGIMVTMPDGAGITFNVNGSELTLMGTASLKATKNGTMEVSMYDGSGRIVANGEEQYFGAGEKVTVQLGGPDGTDSVSGPSDPEPLSPEDEQAACTMTGTYCSRTDIQHVDEGQAQQTVQPGLGITSTVTRTTGPSATHTPVATSTSAVVLTPVFSHTPSRTPTPSQTALVTAFPTRTYTRTVTRTPTVTQTPTRTRTPTRTNSPTITNTPTYTSTPTDTPTSTATTTPPTELDCTNVTTAGLSWDPTAVPPQLTMNLVNSVSPPSPVSIDSIHLVWVKPSSSPSLRLTAILLNGGTIFNATDPNSPSDIPSERDWASGATLEILDGATVPLVMQFSDVLGSGDQSIAIVFDIGCQVRASVTIP